MDEENYGESACDDLMPPITANANHLFAHFLYMVFHYENACLCQ